MGIAGALYVRIHALRLDQIHPFFEQVDFYVGLVLLAGVLLLNWLHWGGLLTSLVLITIVYFFLRRSGADSPPHAARVRTRTSS